MPTEHGLSRTSLQTQSLLAVISNPIVFDNLVQYLPLKTLFLLARTSAAFRDFIFTTSTVFHYLDLSRCKGAYIPAIAPIDTGGHSWRAQRMDENLTEDEFYAGPLRGVLSRLSRKNVLHHVQTLVLDGLASVTNDLLHEIVTDSRYSVRLLSIRQCINVNQVKLQQLLIHICRPSRPENTPRLKGLYVFTNPTLDKSNSTQDSSISGVTLSDGATLGILPVDKSRHHSLDTDPWYAPVGQVTKEDFENRSSWEETLQTCRGIIAFDAVLCTHMHEAVSHSLHDWAKHDRERKPGIPPIATIALGPEGCTGCGKAPEGTPIWGEADLYEFPLLSPPPHSGRLSDAVRPPPRHRSYTANQLKSPLEPQRLIVSCSHCLFNRHCDSCHRWWCPDCYKLKTYSLHLGTRTKENTGTQPSPDPVKVFNGLCVEHCLVGEMMAGAGSSGMWA